MGGETHAPKEAPGAGHGGHGHGHGDHHPMLAHHFDSMQQQFDSSKLGMWLFLSTEVLLFAGLFCAYTVYRGNHPEVFIYASKFLNTSLGALNTVILLASSFTVAMAVRSAQLNLRKQTVVYLALTLLGALGFLTVKYFEYSHKIHEGLMWGLRYEPSAHALEAVSGGHGAQPGGEQGQAAAPAPSPANPVLLVAAPPSTRIVPRYELERERSAIEPAAVGPQGMAPVPAEGAPPPHPVEGVTSPDEVRNVHIFFGIYFLMTGLHGLHVLIGMAAIGWVMWRAHKGHFDSTYYAPVDLVGLYWHLVDLIWIYLFPLLYLIG